MSILRDFNQRFIIDTPRFFEFVGRGPACHLRCHPRYSGPAPVTEAPGAFQSDITQQQRPVETGTCRNPED